MRRLPAVIGLLLSATSAVAAQTITVKPAGDLSSLVGMPFDVPIVADWTARADRLGSFAVTLRWNPAVLRFDGGVPGSFGTLEANTDSAAQGVLKLAGANPAGLTGMITLAVGRFTPLAASTTPVTLQLGDIFSAAPDFADLSGAASVQSGLFCPARGYWGDPDLDGTAGSRDALIALSEAVGLDVSAFPEHGLADVTADGVVRANDALVILSYAVGMDVGAFRVQRIAVGSCGSDLTTAYSVTPSGDTVVGGHEQEIHFELRATAGGAVRSLPDVFWRTSNPAVLVVLPDGRALPTGPGTAVVTGKSGQRDSATATIVVVGRRTKHVVDALAVGAANRLGTPAHPYAALGEASAVAAEGDTLIVRAGRYADAASFNVGVVILGQSGGSGVVLAGQDDFFNAPLSFTGGARAEVHNVTADRVAIGIAAIGVDTLVVDSLRYFEGSGRCGDYGVAAADIWRLEVRRSQLRGGGQNDGCAIGIGLIGSARVLLVEDLEASDFADDVIYAPSVDSAVVRRSQIHDNGGYAVDVGASPFIGFSGEVPAPTSTALVVEDSRFLRSQFSGGVAASDVRGGIVTRTVIESVEGDGIYLSGTPDLADRFKIVADTIRGHENYWLTAYDVDTLLVDSTVVLQTQDGYATGFAYARVTRSRFVDVISGTVLYFDGDYAAPAIVDSVTMNGDPACHRCAEGFAFYATPSTVSHLTATNFEYVVEQHYAGGSVDHSTFADVNTGVYGYDNLGTASRSEVRAVTMTNMQYGIENYSGAVVADSLDLTSGAIGVYAAFSPFIPSGRDSVRNSTIRDFDTAIQLNDSTMVVSGNTIIRPTSYGVQLNGPGTLTDSAIVVNNTIACDASGGFATAFYGYGASYRVSGNAISGCNAGLNLTSTTVGSASVRGNTISMPPNAPQPAIMVPSPLRSEIVGNTVLGGGPGGGIFASGYSSVPVPYARVDSNIVRGVQQRAIMFAYTDSLQARGNLIDTVATSSGYSSGGMGIAVLGTTNGSALIIGNRIRHVQGHGIFLDHDGAALLVVDSNAVSTSDTSAVRLATGQLSMTGNNIRNNARYGLWVLTFGGTHDAHGNAFQGNGLYAAIAENGSAINADGNWWGQDGQPPNSAGTDSTFGVVDNAPLASDPTPLLPSLSRPVLARYVPPLAPATRTMATLRQAPRVAPVSGAGLGVERNRAVAPQLAARRAARAALPAPLAPLRARGGEARTVRAAAVRSRDVERLAKQRAVADRRTP
jgi:hypothetical protein